MPIYNFGIGNGIYPTINGAGIYDYNNGTYSYSNGALSSSTTFVNGIPYTQNIMMLNGTGAGCGDTPCPQGYSLYFPCLKNITRGEDVCFEFYVVNNETRDVVDLRTVEALTITLTGNFGCVLGTYMYPSDDGFIRPLQSQEYKSLMDENFKERPFHYLTVTLVDEKLDEISEKGVEGKVGKYFDGDTVELTAYDTSSYIFVGWIDIDADNDEECDDFYLSTDRKLTFEIKKDMNIAAVYRERKTFKISLYQGNATFSYYKNGEERPLYDGYNVKEGKHIIVRVIPFNEMFLDWEASNFGESKHSEVENILLKIEVLSDVSLKINGISLNDIGESDNDLDLYDLNFIEFSFNELLTNLNMNTDDDVFEEHELVENDPNYEITFFENTDISSVFDECKPTDYDKLYCYYSGGNCILRFGDNEDNGFLEFSNPGIETETVLEVYCMKYGNLNSSVSVSLDGLESQVQEIEEEGFNKLIFNFEKTDFNKMKVSSLGEVFPEERSGQCFIDRITVSDMNFIDKGKAALCLPGSETGKFYRGKITATGAIRINGANHGLPCAMVGNVTNIPIINII